MMFKYSFKLDKEAHMIEMAVTTILDEGFRTKDIITSRGILLSTSEMGARVIAQLDIT
jgi:3-isopropylmalate dehydrogenase